MDKPDWCNYNKECDDIWNAKCNGYPIFLYDCVSCLYSKFYKPQPRILNPLIAEFVYKTNERLRK